MRHFSHISKEFHAHIAHLVPTQDLPQPYKPKCRNLHGHTVTIIANIKGFINNKTRMLIDYTLLDSFKQFIDIYLDHKLILARPFHKYAESIYDMFNKLSLSKEKGCFHMLNDIVVASTQSHVTCLNVESTTAEDMSFYLGIILLGIIHSVSPKYKGFITDVYVEFKETPKSSAISYLPRKIMNPKYYPEFIKEYFED